MLAGSYYSLRAELTSWTHTHTYTHLPNSEPIRFQVRPETSDLNDTQASWPLYRIPFVQTKLYLYRTLSESNTTKHFMNSFINEFINFNKQLRTETSAVGGGGGGVVLFLVGQEVKLLRRDSETNQPRHTHILIWSSDTSVCPVTADA